MKEFWLMILVKNSSLKKCLLSFKTSIRMTHELKLLSAPKWTFYISSYFWIVFMFPGSYTYWFPWWLTWFLVWNFQLNPEAYLDFILISTLTMICYHQKMIRGTLEYNLPIFYDDKPWLSKRKLTLPIKLCI